jgi:hypothetical protein
LFGVRVLSCEKISVVKIDGITTDVWSDNRSNWRWFSNIPNFDVIIPTSRDDKIWIICAELRAEHSITVTWFTGTSTLKFDEEASCLFIVDSNNLIFTTSKVLGTIWVVITSKKLIELIMDGVE